MLNLYEVALPETHQRIWEDVSAPFTISLPDLAAPVSCLGPLPYTCRQACLPLYLLR